MPRLSQVSLLWKILLSTSIAITILFAVTGWIVQENATRITSTSIAQEVEGSFQAYDSLWRSRADKLASVSLVLSRMSDVRAAFGTGDQATIRDTAGELWDKISHEDAIFLVTDPRGVVIASLGGNRGAEHRELEVVPASAPRFPQQSAGFLFLEGRLYQIAVTPVYVASAQGSALLDVLVAGYAVDANLAKQLKDASGGSDFVFLSGGRSLASTLPPELTPELEKVPSAAGAMRQVNLKDTDYSLLSTPLLDVRGRPIGELRILRSFEAARRRILTLRQNIVIVWLVAVLAGLALTYYLARRILEPVQSLDRAASEIGRGNYDVTVETNGDSELGRLSRTFNAMCASIRSAREELIRKEQIDTIGRLATSVVHDLRNPLAAIYGGAEMLVDGELSPAQIRRLAGNIYGSSRHVQTLLQDLVDVTRGRTFSVEPCHLKEVVTAAFEPLCPLADSLQIAVTIDVPDDLEVPVERFRMERVFANLITNSLEAMPDGGALKISSSKNGTSVTVKVEDTGSGISGDVKKRLFQPFVTAGKKNGLGLGLALSRQTVLDHGGDLWVESEPEKGACFFLRLPA